MKRAFKKECTWGVYGVLRTYVKYVVNISQVLTFQHQYTEIHSEPLEPLSEAANNDAKRVIHVHNANWKSGTCVKKNAEHVYDVFRTCVKYVVNVNQVVTFQSQYTEPT